MDERARGELPPHVTVTVPTQEEIRDFFRRLSGETAMYDTNPAAFRLLRCGRKEILFRLGYD